MRVYLVLGIKEGTKIIIFFVFVILFIKKSGTRNVHSSGKQLQISCFVINGVILSGVLVVKNCRVFFSFIRLV